MQNKSTTNCNCNAKRNSVIERFKNNFNIKEFVVLRIKKSPYSRLSNNGVKKKTYRTNENNP